MFNLQRFGTNDTVTASNVFTMEYDIGNNKTQKITISQGNPNVAEDALEVVMTADLEAGIFVSKEDESVVLGTDTATIEAGYLTEKTTRELDLT